MLYHLLAPFARDHILFNLFTYISFRAAGAMITALFLAFAVGPEIIRRLREHKIGQVIRAEGLASHQGKRGTPTMGGLIILLAFAVGPEIIRRLREHKIGQVIRAEGLASHQGKRGTPTMGGLIILLATVIP